MMIVKSSKANTLVDGLIEGILSVLDERLSKLCTKTIVINRKKVNDTNRSKRRPLFLVNLT